VRLVLRLVRLWGREFGVVLALMVWMEVWMWLLALA
jgi:hypothetical protein